MIKTSGNRVSPTEVEESAVGSGFAAEAVALGVPDDRLGERIALILRSAEERGADREAELRNHLKRELPNFMQPAEIVWRKALPRTANGKVDRELLRSELLGG